MFRSKYKKNFSKGYRAIPITFAKVYKMYVTIMFLPIKSEVTVELALVIKLIIDFYYIPIISRWHSQAFIRSVPAFARCKVSDSPTIAVKNVYSGIHVPDFDTFEGEKSNIN